MDINKQKTMKLYTEEQIKEIYFRGWKEHYKEVCIDFIQIWIDSLTPIELPNDDEIGNACIVETNNLPSEMFGFIIGAKWMRDKIQGNDGSK